MTRRNLVHIAREPHAALGRDDPAGPVHLLFVYMFGAGVPIPGGGSYKDFAIAGLLALNLTTSAMGTAVGLSTDLHTGIIDRFRTLPMWRPAVLVGRSIADLLTAVLCAAIVALTGLAIGWRPTPARLSVIGGFGLVLLFAYALAWARACLGMITKGPESAASIGFIVLFPLAFVSNALVPTQHMPRLAAADRQLEPGERGDRRRPPLFGQPEPVGAISRLAHAAPGGGGADLVGGDPRHRRSLASYFFKRRTTE